MDTATLEPKVQKRATFRLRNFFSTLGPGLITGASDDDPSGIGTYSQAGAQLGFGIGWTMLLTYPLMTAIQEISARIGRVTGHGIAGNVCRNFGPAYVWGLVVLLFAANTINIAADLGAMADALKVLIGGPGILYVVTFGAVSVFAQIFFDYNRYVAVLKWLTLSLFAYVIALAVVKVPWTEALKGVLIPHVSWNAEFLTTLVAILGTTISPYLFIWQSSQEAEEQRIDDNKTPLKKDTSTAEAEFRRIRLDTLIGMAFSNLIALSIIITTAATLHAQGKTDIQSSAQAAEALKPIAGPFAELIFALGIIGTGLLAIPVLAGSTAYAIGEGRRWKVGLSRKTQGGHRLLHGARPFRPLRHRFEFYADRPHQGTVLERGRQRRAGGTGYGDPDAAGAATEGDGRSRGHRPAVLARLGCDDRDGLLHRRHGGHHVHGRILEFQLAAVAVPILVVFRMNRVPKSLLPGIL